ncbi:hypothetical protein TNCV_4578641 [Trichonephila clavipes]|nr:hypothetical protein TNCV_4578641 [Trichonephila clavipes]
MSKPNGSGISYWITLRLDTLYNEGDSAYVSTIAKSINDLLIGCDNMTATAGSEIVQSGRPIFDDIFQHLWPYIGNNTANVVLQMVKRLWLIRIDQ